ncbi:MAG TPA: PAS domain S-box protein [Acetobacteraceae bacterium]
MPFNESQFAVALVAEMPDAVVYADRDGTIRFWNGGAARIFGYTAAEAVGQSLDLIIPESLRARHWAGYRQTLASGQTRYGTGDLLAVPALRRDGARISIEFTILPFHGADGAMSGIAAVMRDVTRRFEETRALRRELEVLRRGRA